VVDLVLASASPRRLELIARLGLCPEVVPCDVDESWHPVERAQDYVARVALDKAVAGSAARPGAVVLAADTAVVLDGEPLGKPIDDDDARRMLRRLAGRSHTVITAVAVCAPGGGPGPECRSASARVRFAPFGEADVEWYVGTGEPTGKAGAYALQGAGAVLVERVEGDPTTVIGLPLRLAAEMLRRAGIDVPGR
jgi:septum formation protein